MGVTLKGGRIIGYARVSTEDQNLEMQIAALKRADVHDNHLYVEKVSGSSKRRPQLELMLKSLREGDRVVFWKFDRLARSMQDLLGKVERIRDAGAEFISLTEAVDTETPGGQFMLHLLAAFAQFERDLIRQRTKAGVEAAKLRGVRFGQPKKVTKKTTVDKMKKWRKERVPFREIRKRIFEQDKLKLSITTIDKYVTGKVKL